MDFPLPHADGEVGFGNRVAAEPARRDGLGLGVELNGLLTVGVLVTVEGTLPAGEREERQGHRNGDVDAHLPHQNLVLVLARGAAGGGGRARGRPVAAEPARLRRHDPASRRARQSVRDRHSLADFDGDSRLADLLIRRGHGRASDV